MLNLLRTSSKSLPAAVSGAVDHGQVLIKYNLIFGLLLCFGFIVPSYSQSVEKQAVLAALTHNVARFASWPENVFDSEAPVFNLCVIGNNVVQESFAKMNNKIVSGKTLHILNRSRLRNLSNCQLLYISGLKHNILVHVLLELKGLPVLTVGENMQFLEAGGMVSLEKINGKIQLNINLPIIKQSVLELSSRILKLANLYDFPYPEN